MPAGASAVPRAGVAVPGEPPAIDAEAGGNEGVERLGLAHRAAVPVEDVEPPHGAQHHACFEAGRHVRSDPGGVCEPIHVELFEPVLDLVDVDEVRVTPHQLLHLIRLLTFSGSHPGIAQGELLTPTEVVDTILDGVRVRPGPGRKTD